MNPFQAGDVVECVDDGGNRGIRLGDRYEVEEIRGSNVVKLKGLGGQYFIRRFVLAAPKHPFMVGSLR
jgi:hypothetical protein